MIYNVLLASGVQQSEVVVVVKNPPAKDEGDVRDLGSTPSWKDSLEDCMETHSSILAWEIPGTEEPGGSGVHGVTKSWTQLKRLIRVCVCVCVCVCVPSVF